MEYPASFKDLVNNAYQKSQELYAQPDHQDTANPYYIGKGNPHADILLIGKELAIDPVSNPKAFQNESIKNPEQWHDIIHGKSIENKFDPRWPYEKSLPKSAGATWNQYQRLNNLLFDDNQSETASTFFHKFFLTEINTTPSKYSPGRSKILGELHLARMRMFKEEQFFQGFPIVIVAAGGYWHIADIQAIFGEALIAQNQSSAQNKFITFTDPTRQKLVISTRQLSTAVSGELMQKIVEEINRFRKLKVS